MSTFRKTRSGGFASTGSSISKTKNGINKITPGEEEFLKMIELAEYEINVDPYRGIRPLMAYHQKIEHGTSPHSPMDLDTETVSGASNSPIDDKGDISAQQHVEENVGWWLSSCSMRPELHQPPTTALMESQNTQASFTYSSDAGEIISVADDSIEEQQQLPQRVHSTHTSGHTSGFTCPSLLKWMAGAQQRNEKRAAKRKRKSFVNSDTVVPGLCGRRYSDDAEKECLCDYNPFCIWTLGGVMDEMLEQLDNERTVTREPPTPPCESPVNTEDDVIVLDDATTPMDISSDGGSDDNAIDFFKPRTLEMLKKVRKWTIVDETSIRSYLQKILLGLTKVLSIDEGVEHIRSLQETLVFTNPVLPNDHSGTTPTAEDSHDLRLSMPPGIENLGATCYLNTQLQCLAQNLVFVDGIMSWRPSTDGNDDPMTSVLTLFQDLLLHMTSGPHSTVNTLEFSNALGLDHFEQQDPNEFSRLFFDRVHNSFKGSDSNKNLADLLPRLFQGEIAYEITCLVCGTKSKRTEEFMDLNLPIVKRKRVNLGAQRKIDLFQSKFDTDVQYCLNEYCSDEMLDGENQYHCTQCKGKCDAKRAVSFQMLPPVLNVQLYRYIFNREKLMKTKLSDKVLLPLYLDVQSFNGRQSESSKNKYYLCAIMRHKGTSAYSGHYVAEAMDWRSGQWFEFNDASVTHLKNGPSNCYDPSTHDLELEELTNHSKTIQLFGSTDAYNMYYVEESFLAHCILEKMRRLSDLIDEPPLCTSLMSKERSKYFDELRQLCLDDERVANQLKKRQEKISTDFLPKLTLFDVNDSDNLVWVETLFLRQFLSCKELLDTQPICEAIPPHHAYLCSHTNPALHPRIARRGKLLPTDACDSLVIIINGEIHDTAGADIPHRTMHDLPIFPLRDIVCEDCAQEYRAELVEKFSFTCAVKSLYDELDPKVLKCSRYLQAGESIKDASDQYVYIVSRKFISWFRNKTTRFLKQAICAKVDEPKRQSGATGSISSTSITVGLDGLDIDAFWNLEASKFKVVACGAGEDEGLAVRVNGHLTCHHGNYISSTPAISIILVQRSLWESIKALFPAAIEHKRKRLNTSQELEDSDEDNDLFGCKHCQEEVVSNNCRKRNFEEFAKYCQTSQQNRILSRDNSAVKALSTDTKRFYLVPMVDFEVWNKVLTVLSKKRKGKEDQTYQRLVESVLLKGTTEGKTRSSGEEGTKCLVSDEEHTILELFSRFFSSAICDDHGLYVFDTFFQNVSEGLPKEPLELRDDICIVTEEDYQQFLSHVGAASIILCRSENGSLWKEVTVHDILAQGRSFLNRIQISMHNYCVPASGATEVVAKDLFFIYDKQYQLSYQSCRNITCRQAYKTNGLAASRETQVTSGTDTCNGVIDDPIDIDMDTKPCISPPNVSLVVLDVKADAELRTVLHTLEIVDGLTSRDEQELEFYPRRSSRRRASRYCSGDVLGDETIEIPIDNNIAALRLALMERCTKGTEFELNHSLTLVFLIQFKADDKVSANDEKGKSGFSRMEVEPLFKMIDLPFSSNRKTIRDMCEEGLGGPYDLAITTFLIRQANAEPSSEQISKDELMDTLLSLANTPSESKANGAKQKTSRTEKGFSGTFLSLATAPKAAAVETTTLNHTESLSTATLPIRNGVHDDSLDFHRRSVEKPHVTGPTHENGTSQDDKGDLLVTLNETKPAAFDCKPGCPSSASNCHCITEIFDDAETVDKGKPEIKPGDFTYTTTRVHSDMEIDKSISVDDDSSEGDVELLFESPFKKSNNNASPSKQFKTKRIQLTLDSMGVQDSSNKKAQIDKARSDGPCPMARLTSEIVRRLVGNPDIHEQNNEDLCQIAAESAIEMHPHLNDADDLVDRAYELYMQLIQ